VTLELDDEVYEHLKNILTWAALWDIKCNNDRNKAVYDKVLAAVIPGLADQDVT
jgi:hypothetical protein